MRLTVEVYLTNQMSGNVQQHEIKKIYIGRIVEEGRQRWGAYVKEGKRFVYLDHFSQTHLAGSAILSKFLKNHRQSQEQR